MTTSSASASSPSENWRLDPGYLSGGESEFESSHILLGHFLADRTSKSPLNQRSLLEENPTFEWGKGAPLEKVIDSPEAFEALMLNPQIFRNSVAILEPWKHVGHNPLGEEVRASVNVAYLVQRIADCDSIVFPLWQSGVLDPKKFAPVISSGLVIVMEGGNPSAYDPTSFAESACSHAELVTITEEILLSRTPTSAPAIFICLGHQLLAQAHISLIRKAVAAVEATEAIQGDDDHVALKALQRACEKIKSVGEALTVVKGGEKVATGWNDPQFTVARNEVSEVGDRQLVSYSPPHYGMSHVPEELILAHEVVSDKHEGVMDTSIQYENNLKISMFHSDEVNEEAVLLANWAYCLLHDVMIPHRHLIVNSPLSWLIRLPDAIEILCSTTEHGEVVTECSATCVNYQDFETKEVRRSFSCQFHPELLTDLRAIGVRKPPSYAELKDDDGARLFARLLYASMHE